MRKTREILRQKWCLGRSHREVARSLGKSLGAISATLARATSAGLDWEAVGALSDEALDERLYGAPAGGGQGRVLPDFAVLHAEHKRPGVTLELLTSSTWSSIPAATSIRNFASTTGAG